MSQETKYFKDAVNGMHYYKVNGSSTNGLHIHVNRTNEPFTYKEWFGNRTIVQTIETGSFCMNNLDVSNIELWNLLPCKHEEFREVMAWVDYQIANM